MKPERPNLVYVMADQLRYKSCGYAGDERARTPCMDSLAGSGMSFRQAISGHPMCAPYRASLFTGKYSSSTGMVINEIRMNPNHECLAHVLTRSGYDTSYIGKWHLWAAEFGNHLDPGNSYTPPGPDRLGFDGYWAAYNFHHEYYKDAYYHTNSPEQVRLDCYEPDGQTDLAIARLKAMAGGDSPFALFLSYGTPHDPWGTDNVPSEYYRMFGDTSFPDPPNFSPESDPYGDGWTRMSDDFRARLEDRRRVYYAMTTNLDWNLGRLITAMDDLGVAENTIFVFTSDHGELFGAHGRHGKNIFYEEAVRVPFIMRWPEHIPEGSSSDVLLNTPDIMPTILTLMDLRVPDGVEGRNLAHCALGEPGPVPSEAFLQGMGSVAIWDEGYEWRAIRNDRFTFAVYRKDGRELLFDHRSDPFQMKDLSRDAEHTDTVEEMRSTLTRRMSALGDTFEASTWYRDNWTKDRIIVRTATLSPAGG